MNNAAYLEYFLKPIKSCKIYRPKFGGGNLGPGVSLNEFLILYGQDPFYSWIGLDTPLMYAAHKAAGGMTSVYRQIGIGCEVLFRKIIIDQTQYSDVSWSRWNYQTETKSGITKTLTLDGRLEISQINNINVKENVISWIADYCKLINAKLPSSGVVFEVRQGYKSKDSKRQNADIDNVSVAWANSYLPVFAIFSGQIDIDLILRYKNNRAGILTGVINNDPYISLFAFCEKVLEFDLIDFFENNSVQIKREIRSVLETLLKAE